MGEWKGEKKDEERCESSQKINLWIKTEKIQVICKGKMQNKC